LEEYDVKSNVPDCGCPIGNRGVWIDYLKNTINHPSYTTNKKWIPNHFVPPATSDITYREHEEV